MRGRLFSFSLKGAQKSLRIFCLPERCLVLPFTEVSMRQVLRAVTFCRLRLNSCALAIKQLRSMLGPLSSVAMQFQQPCLIREGRRRTIMIFTHGRCPAKTHERVSVAEGDWAEWRKDQETEAWVLICSIAAIEKTVPATGEIGFSQVLRTL